MILEEPKIIRLQLSHQLIGIQNFEISSRDNFSDLRLMLTENTQMGIFENFRFTLNGKLLSEFQEIGQMIQNETRIIIVLQPFDEKSSYYHLEKVKEVISNPMEWVMRNTKETMDEQSQSPHLPENITIDNFLDSKITSVLLEPQLLFPIQFFESLNFSIHNPPQMQRRLTGDFYYLVLRTLEGHEEHITACPQGFYVNNSTNSYLGTANAHNIFFYNLIDLLKYCSPKFKLEFNNLKNVFKQTELDKSIFNSFNSSKFSPMTEWLKTNQAKKIKYNHWKYANLNIPSETTNITEWNEIIQRHSILIPDSLIDASNKEKNQHKLYQDYVNFAKEAASKVIDGKISPINMSDPVMKKVFCYESVYIWFIEDDPMLYTKEIDGHATRRKMNVEIRNLGMMERSKNVMVNYLHYVLVNYKGHNVVVQPIVLGLPPNLMNSSIIGGIRGEKCVDEIAKAYRIENLNVFKNEKELAERAFVHPELEVCKADDKRNYIVNLHSLSPRDLNFPTIKNNASVLRKELIDSFNVGQKCSRNVNTMIESGFNLIFNEKVKEQHVKLKSIKTYAEEIVVPLCLKSFLRENKKYLADSKSVVKVLHQFGLGSRYLGMMHRKASELELNHVQIVIERTIIVKTLKNIFRQAMRKAELGDLKQTICRLLNCIFCTTMEETFMKDDFKDEISTNASRKKKKKQDYEWETQEENYLIKPTIMKNTVVNSGQIRPQELWDQIKEITKLRYGIEFEQKKVCELKCFDNEYGKYAILRDLCISLGICIEKCEYFQRSGSIFKPENIEEIKPLAKSISISNKFFENLIEQGDLCIEKKKVEEAIDFYNQAINYATTIFGIMTEQLSVLNKKVAQIYFRIEEMDAAMLFIHCALKMSEKIYGESHIETIECYNLSSQFHFFLRNFKAAEYYLIKSIHISTVSYGEEYPEIVLFYLNLATIYEATSRFMDAITSVSHALRIVLKFYGDNHLNTAVCYASMSTLHFEIPDIEKSIFFQEKSIEILKKVLLSEDSRLKEAQKLLDYYHQLQTSKKVKENHDKERKKILANHQLFAGFPLFKFSDFGKDREQMYRKMHSFMQSSNKFLI